MNETSRSTDNAVDEVDTFCRICEPMCALIGTVEDGRLVKVRNNPDHVHSRGHFCKKAIGMMDITYDPDRVIYPLKRTGAPGEFSQISWDQALGEIAEKLLAIRSLHGADSFATFSGNTSYFNYATLLTLGNFCQTLNVKWQYGINGDDAGAHLTASQILYGSAGVLPKPDLWRTRFLLVIGGNPLAAHGSMLSEPLMAKALREIVNRGGRVVVLDPRRTETAHSFDHIPIRAGSDSWFLAAFVRELIFQGYVNQEFITRHTDHFDQLRALVNPYTAEIAELHTGIAAHTIRELAREHGGCKEGAAIYARTGTCTQRFGTLTNLLLQLMTIITGNLDRAGGMCFGWNPFGSPKMAIRLNPSRTTGQPEVAGLLPSTALISDIEQDGVGQVRALMVIGANPARSSAASGPSMDAALDKLDLLFSLDIYVTETNRFADYILPAAVMFEREDFPLLLMGWMQRPSIFATRPVVARQGEVREEWEVFYELAERMGLGPPLPNASTRSQAVGLTMSSPVPPTHPQVETIARITPRDLIDQCIRASSIGDNFGSKPEGLTFDKLLNQPNGVSLLTELPVGMFEETIATANKRIDLAPSQLASELTRLVNDRFYDNPDFPLRLHGMREVLTHNSWMHNAHTLARRERPHGVHLHPNDAAARGIADGDVVQIRSPFGAVLVNAKLSDAMMPGNVALPHGWGHNGSWKTANARGGVCSNFLSSSDPGDTEKLAGMSVLNGIPVQIACAEYRQNHAL